MVLVDTCTGEGSAKTYGKHFWRATAVETLPSGARKTDEECRWCKARQTVTYGGSGRAAAPSTRAQEKG